MFWKKSNFIELTGTDKQTKTPIEGQKWQSKDGGFYRIVDRFESVKHRNLCVAYEDWDNPTPLLYVRDMPQFMKNFTRVEG